MAQKYVVVERKNPLKPQEPAKFYAMARSNRRVDTDEVISRVSERSSYSIGELKVQSPNQKIPDRKTKCVIKTHINIKQNVIFGAKLKPV